MTTVNVSATSISGNCDQKCVLEIDKYTIMPNITCQNMVGFIQIMPANPTAYCIFNKQKFQLTVLEIARPSRFLYNGAQASAEIVLAHKELDLDGTLEIIIPITAITNSLTSLTPQAQQIVEDLINATVTYAPQQNDTTINVTPFSAKDLIPKAPFYFFTLTPNSNNNVITFGMNSCIQISDDVMTKLSTLLSPSPAMALQTTVQIFANSHGPIVAQKPTSNDIYIDCQPTDHSDETVGIEGKHSMVGDISFKTLANMPAVIIAVSLIIFFIVLWLIYTALIFSRKGLESNVSLSV